MWLQSYIAMRFLGDPELHLNVRQQVVQYLSDNRDNNDLHIYDGIEREQLFRSGFPPCTYSSYDDYISKMSRPHTYIHGSTRDYRGNICIR